MTAPRSIRSPVIKEPCLACGKALFRKGPLDPEGRYWGKHVDDKIEQKFDGVDHYYECPYCQVHNVVISSGTGFRISHVKKRLVP